MSTHVISNGDQHQREHRLLKPRQSPHKESNVGPLLSRRTCGTSPLCSRRRATSPSTSDWLLELPPGLSPCAPAAGPASPPSLRGPRCTRRRRSGRNACSGGAGATSTSPRRRGRGGSAKTHPAWGTRLGGGRRRARTKRGPIAPCSVKDIPYAAHLALVHPQRDMLPHWYFVCQVRLVWWEHARDGCGPNPRWSRYAALVEPTAPGFCGNGRTTASNDPTTGWG